MSDAPRETDAERAARRHAEAEPTSILTPEAYRRRSRRAFLVGGSAAAAGFLGWRWLRLAPEDGNIPWPLRTAHEFNEALWRGLYSPDRLAPTFDRSRASALRVNGRHGLRTVLDLDTWAMELQGPDGAVFDRLDMSAIEGLPFVEMTTEFKCIEGWSEIVHWGGVRFSDFAARWAPTLVAEPYVGLATPDGAYTVGMDMASMLHPQTLLATHLNGEPLTPPHGAPLRLVTPLKYGVKQLKRIGVIRFMSARPSDYWTERGYDWYVGH